MHRLIRAFASLVMLLAAYWVYALVAVPLIEPEAVRPPSTPHLPVVVDKRLPEQIERLLPYFEHDAPELHDPIVLESPTFSLLLKDYRTLPDRRVEIKPCTIVFFPDGQPAQSGQRVRAIIMRAPGGAVLDFDEDCDLSRAKIGRLLGGRLVGEVTIRGNLSRGGDPHDASGELFATTRDVQLNQERIWTPHDVQFRLGTNHGSGSDLQLVLTHPAAGSGATRHAAPRGIESIQLLRDVRLTVELSGGSLLGGATRHVATTDKPSGPRATAGPPQPPVEIQCQGPFRFDLGDNVATFEDRVNVVRMNPTGPGDQMTCDFLAIHFARDPKTTPPPLSLATDNPSQPATARDGGMPGARTGSISGTDKPGSFFASEIEARGNPVSVRAPSMQAEARGEHFEYQLQTGSLLVEGEQPVWLRYGPQQIVSRLVRYTPGPPGHAAEVLAEGAGRLTGSMPNNPAQHVEASWSRQLSLRPHEGKQLLSVLGEARLSLTDAGSLAADEIWLWLLELPPVAPLDGPAGETRETALAAAGPRRQSGHSEAAASPLAGRFLPHSMLARGSVRLESPQIGGRTDQLEAWFQPAAADPAAAGGSAGGPASSGSLLSGNARSGAGAHYEFAGRLTRVQLVVQGQQMAVRDVAMSGGVTLSELPAEGSGDKPMRLSGDDLQLLAADAPSTTLIVKGQPAHVEARGLALSGANIHLDKAANRLWIDGEGTMTLPMSRDLEGHPTAVEQPLAVSFAQGMTFDGRTVCYNDQVVARTQQQRLDTARMTVQLVEPIDFSRPALRGRPEVRQLACVGGVRLENRSQDNGRLVSIDRMQTADLTVEQQSGDVRATGPGWVSSVRAQQATSLVPPGAGPRRPMAPARNGGSGLSYLRIRFQQGITGNLHRREMTFADQVTCVYGPVAQWTDEISVERASELTPDQVLLSCDRLTATDLGLAGAVSGAGGRPIELEASGNARVDGQTFSAEGDRLTYAAEKQLLVLEGTGESDAHLWRQVNSGEPSSHASARKILYWRATNRVEVHDARFLDLNQLGRAP